MNYKHAIKILIMVLVTVPALSIIYLFKGEIRIQIIELFAAVLIALLAGSGASFLTGKVDYKDKSIKASQDKAVFFIVFFAIVSAQFGFPDKEFDVTIYLRDKNEQSTGIEGKLRMKFANSVREEFIDRYGAVNYRGLSSSLRNKFANAEIVDEGNWQFVNGKKSTNFLVTDKDTTLIIEPDTKLCCLQGTVFDEKKRFLEGVEVWVDTLKPVKTSNIGQYVIKLPYELRTKKEFELNIRKGIHERHNIVIDRIQNPEIQLKIR